MNVFSPPVAVAHFRVFAAPLAAFPPFFFAPPAAAAASAFPTRPGAYFGTHSSLNHPTVLSHAVS